jgi:hypothetical protein
MLILPRWLAFFAYVEFFLCYHKHRGDVLKLCVVPVICRLCVSHCEMVGARLSSKLPEGGTNLRT